ncbi:MAG: hypothetical protein VB962_05575, partial [Pseudohongiellaceae bacterium]
PPIFQKQKKFSPKLPKIGPKFLIFWRKVELIREILALIQCDVNWYILDLFTPLNDHFKKLFPTPSLY